MPGTDIELRLVLSNVPDERVAAQIAHALVDERLAACVNVFAACRSVYRWQGAIETADEITLLVKTTRARHDECVRRLAELHPYDVPEIVTLVPEQVWPAYAQWAAGETAAGAGS
ncbi:MAG: divalent-cation tolerance protein CutA [Burkholderiaceae bacterium]|nr:divalent-cation tolerance protein CutA [Burkholderiaceae bacterium]